MKVSLKVLGAVCLLQLVSWTAHAKTDAVPTREQVMACYEKAEKRDDIFARGECLSSELSMVIAEHKDAVERVAAFAKAWDKSSGRGNRWLNFIQSTQAFDKFVKQECNFIEQTTKGSRRKELNAGLACRISYYRMHTDVLENRFLNNSRR